MWWPSGIQSSLGLGTCFFCVSFKTVEPYSWVLIMDTADIETTCLRTWRTCNEVEHATMLLIPYLIDRHAWGYTGSWSKLTKPWCLKGALLSWWNLPPHSHAWAQKDLVVREGWVCAQGSARKHVMSARCVQSHVINCAFIVAMP